MTPASELPIDSNSLIRRTCRAILGLARLPLRGLAVVRRLAGKHGIRVRLERRVIRGTTAAVLLPARLVCETPATSWFTDTPTMKIPHPRPEPAPVGVAAGLQGKATPAASTTRHGLPRRVPQSMREFAVFASTVPSPDDPGSGREQLMSDLGDFSDGEQAARRGIEGSPE